MEKKDASVSNEEHASTSTERAKSSVLVSAVSKESGARKYDQKHYGVYCGMIVQKMSRHLFRRHKNEIDVHKALRYPKNSKERWAQLDHIRNKGNYQHNRNVVKSQEGKLISAQQPRKEMKGHEFLRCMYCYGLFQRTSMWRHFRRCKFKPLDKSNPGKQRVQALCAFTQPAPVGFSDLYWRFLNEMIQDQVSLTIKEDKCILEFGYRLFLKNQRQQSQHPYIRQKLRELGRLVLEEKEICPVNSIKELIKPERCSIVVKAARRLAGLN